MTDIFADLPLCCHVWHGSLQATEADIRRKALEAIGPRNPQHAALMQIFERKVLAAPYSRNLETLPSSIHIVPRNLLPFCLSSVTRVYAAFFLF